MGDLTPHAADRDPFERLAEDFLRRHRAGERPPIDEYVAAHPELADAIRDLFPTLILLEDLALDERASPPGFGGEGFPRQLGDYQILRELGRGGMGIVYEAEQESLGRRVAIKVLHLPPGNAKESIERFRREARAAARLHHSHIVPVFGVGEEGGLPFYVMQFIQGQGLDEILHEIRRLRKPDGETATSGSDGRPRTDDRPSSAQLVERLVQGGSNDAEPLPTASVPEPDGESGRPDARDPSRLWAASQPRYHRSLARIGVQIAGALAYAHDQGVVHRDIKPSNLLLDVRGAAWITDFGLAKPQGDDVTLTGDLVGTLRYMAPERFQGWADARSDVYSLGLTLYELLTLRPAFPETDRVRLVERVTRGTPPRPRRLDPRIPRDLETIVLKAIEREPSRRYGSAREMEEDLWCYLEDRPIHARRSSNTEKLLRWCRRNPAVAALSASVALLLLLIAGGALAMTLQLRASLERAERAEGEQVEALWRSYVDQASAHRRRRGVGQKLRSLEALRRAIALVPPGTLDDARRLELRNEVIASTALVDLRFVARWASGRRLYSVVHPGRMLVAEWEPAGELFVRDLRDAHVVRHVPLSPAPIRLLAFDSSGRYLAALQEESLLRILDLENREPVLCERRGVSAVAFAEERPLAAIGGTDGRIAVVDLATGTVREAFRLERPARLMALDADARHLAVFDGQLRAHALADGALVATFTGAPSDPKDLGFSPDGACLAAAGGDAVVHVWERATGKAIARLEGHQAEVMKVGFPPDRDLLVSGSWDGTTRVWDLTSQREILRGSGTFWALDRTSLRLGLSTQTGFEIWALDRGSGVRTLQGHVGRKGPYDAHFSPDGRWMVTSGSDGARVWDVARGLEIAFLPIGDGRCSRFLPDGRSLVTTGSHGLHRWPFECDGEGTALRIGPPEMLSTAIAPGHVVRISTNAAGTRLAYAGDFATVRVFDLERRAETTPLTFARPQACVAISPDGRWLVTRSFDDSIFVVWELARARRVAELQHEGGFENAAFGPDGRWLATGSALGYRFWRVGTWEFAHELPMTNGLAAPVAFTRDGHIAAIARSRYEVRLVRVETGEEVAALAVSDPQHVSALAFGPHDDVLAVGSETHYTHLWDLRALRDQLRRVQMELDVPMQDAGEAPPSHPDLRVDVDVGELGGRRQHLTRLAELAAWHEREGQFERAIATYRTLLEESPADAHACNQLAWLLCTAPAALRAPAEAVALAVRALELEPDNAYFLNTLGVAHYRAGDDDAARAALERAIAADVEGGTAFDWFVLAMALHRLGREDEARRGFARALAWWEAQTALSSTWLQELRAFRAEAEAVLGSR